MWFEDLLILAILGSGIFLIGIPFSKLVRAVIPRKTKTSLQEAKERLEQAKLDAEAARLNKEAEKLYDKMYDETLQEEESKNNQQENHK